MNNNSTWQPHLNKLTKKKRVILETLSNFLQLIKWKSNKNNNKNRNNYKDSKDKDSNDKDNKGKDWLKNKRKNNQAKMSFRSFSSRR